MHDGEVHIDGALVHQLVVSQFPQWRDLPLEPFRSTGTVNAIYRLGDDLHVRLPRVEHWARDLDKELRWLPALAPHVPLEIPEAVARGHPHGGYPFPWAIYRWLPGRPFAPDAVDDEREAAVGLAAFVTALRGVDTAGAPRAPRDGPLQARDAQARAVIAKLSGVVDTDAVTAVWEQSLAAPESVAPAVWTHGDLLPPNLLTRDGHLHAVIDFGSIGAGDPAIDVIAAWSVFGRAARDVFRDALHVDDATWLRARGLALQQALLIIPYYARTNPEFVATAMRTVRRVLDDAGT
jgi:aminoglycoside phosphotransferase (APT) family kinase protein